MAIFAAQKDLRVSREAADRLRAQGRIDEALEEYRKLMRVLAEAGLKLRAQAACKLVLEIAPGDVEATATLATINASIAAKNPSDVTVRVDATINLDASANSDITLEVMPADVVADRTIEARRAPPPLPGDENIELRRAVAHGTRLFAGMHDDIAELAINALDARVFPAGARLMRAGEHADGLYAIESGTVAVAGSDALGGVRAHTIGAGFVVGETCALPDNAATGDVVAHSSVVALFVSAHTIAQLAKRDRVLSDRLALWSVMRRATYSGLRPDSSRALT